MVDNASKSSFKQYIYIFFNSIQKLSYYFLPSHVISLLPFSSTHIYLFFLFHFLPNLADTPIYQFFFFSLPLADNITQIFFLSFLLFPCTQQVSLFSRNFFFPSSSILFPYFTIFHPHEAPCIVPIERFKEFIYLIKDKTYPI
jgi:hypothetical protein